MSHERSRQFITFLLVFGAMVFGVVLAGSLEMTPTGSAAPEPQAPAAAPATAEPASFGLPDFADLAERVSPAVVAIEAVTFDRGRQRGRPSDPWEFFFGPRRRPQPDDEQEFRSESGGSGFVISADGLVVTNNHVIDGAEELKVHLGDDTYDAKVKGVDPATDLALLEIEADGLPYLELGDSERLRVGEWVMAVGSPLGLTDSVTVGVVSAKGRRIFISSDTSFENFIQTDAAINFGNSGGPLLNLSGQVVGINTAINFGSENIGFAVPVDILREILPQLREIGRVRRGYLGIGVEDLRPETVEAFGLDTSEGALVTRVEAGLPADKAGLEHGDIILEADGIKIEAVRQLIDYVSGKGPDAEVVLGILRGGERIRITVQLGERPSAEESDDEPEPQEEGGIEWLGLRYQDLTPGLRQMHSLPEDLVGVWVTQVSPRSPLYDEGVRTDGSIINVITEVNGTAVTSVDVFERVVREAPPGSRLRLYVRVFAGGQERAPRYAFPQVPRSR